MSDHFGKWKLSEPELIAETATCRIYKVRFNGADAALKLLTPLGVEDEAGGAIALRHFGGNGSVRLLEADDSAQLMTFADGPFLKFLDDSEATEVFCELVGRLHSPEGVLPEGLPLMEQNFRALFEAAGPLMEEGAALARRLLISERERVVLHGDLHHKNVLHDSSLGWLAIDPKGLIGERAYDLANIFYNPDDQPKVVESHARIEQMAAVFSSALSIEKKRILQYAFAYGCLSAAWAIEVGLDPSRRLRIAQLIRVLI